jgi:hypothetical protein
MGLPWRRGTKRAWPLSLCGGRAFALPMTTKADDKAYTMKDALKEAADLLTTQFGNADQTAAVQLAIFLHGAHTKEEFMKKRGPVDERSFM